MDTSKSVEIGDSEIQSLFEVIYHKYNYDFRDYAMSSVRRRIASAISRFGFNSVSDLQTKIESDPDFFLQLLQFLTIPTSEMFRDPHFFLAVREKVVPILRTYPSLKIWVVGCSTGEEVYSYAILLKEEKLLDRTTIYATDINPVSLQKAEQGIFDSDRIQEYTSNYQKSGGKETFANYFSTAYGASLVDKEFRKHIVFADHSLATDSVFSEMQFVSCRNVLIYFNKELQDRALGLFHDSLCRRGLLGLGSKETLRFSNYENQFSELSKLEKIYRRIL
jgi:chemotaxis protein methyltransferase CheR